MRMKRTAFAADDVKLVIGLNVVLTSQGCWRWRGPIDRHGYGRLFVKFVGWPRMALAHRLSFAAFRGAIPAGMLVCHHCDNRPCVNPKHLYAGSVADNSRDAWARGRAKAPTRRAQGEAHGLARFKREDIVQIRALVARGMTQTAVGEMFGVRQNHISAIIKRQLWRSVQ